MESCIAISILILSGLILVVGIPLTNRYIDRELRIEIVPIDDALPSDQGR